jgi:hypothetical protein
MTDRPRTITVAAAGLLALALALALVMVLGGRASAGQPPTQTIDAKTDPKAAGDALNFCDVISNCAFVKEGDIKVAYDEPRALGDALYNCGQAEAEDEVTISDERSESTSVEESMSVKASLAFIGFAKASVEAEVKSKQLDEIKTKLTQTNSVSVSPDTIGYTATRVPTAYLDGYTHVTHGVNLINVTNLELTYPGYGNKAIDKIDWSAVHRKMTAQDIQEHCHDLPPIYPSGTLGSPQHSRGAVVMICTGSGGGCGRSRQLTGTDQSIPAGTKLTLARGQTIYAAGVARRPTSTLHARRRVRPGGYQLLLSGPRDSATLSVTLG